MEDDMIVMVLQQAARMLAMIPTDDLERYVREGDGINSRHEAFAPVLDPGAYLDNMRTGKLEDAKNQGKIARALLEARKAIDVREAFAASVREKQSR